LNQVREFRTAARSENPRTSFESGTRVARFVAPGSTLRIMWSWIVIGVLYALVLGGYRLLGGVGAAADALRDWGRASTNGSRGPHPSG
jgi:hypothetical protein